MKKVVVDVIVPFGLIAAFIGFTVFALGITAS